MDFKSLLSKFEGRINGTGYWHAVLKIAVSCVFFLLIFKTGQKLLQAAYLAISGNPLSFDPGFSGALLFFAAWNAEYVASITIKRLHDRDKSGWWMVLLVIAPVLLHRPSNWLDNPTLALVADALGIGLGAWCLVELSLGGTRGSNRFGPDPVTPRKANWVEHGKIEPMPDIAGPPPAWLVKRNHESASADPCCGQ